MLFNSIEYLLFLPLVFALYWVMAKFRLSFQNLLVLVASYIFYGWWDARFLLLIFTSTIVDFFIGQRIYACAAADRKRKYWLYASVFFNLGLLGFFKYFNFFVDSYIDAARSLGFAMQHTWTLNIILPVGISFYTFQTMSYSLDIYYKKLKPTRDFVAFMAFVAFFPQLVAGPIERASNLLSQMLRQRLFNYQQAVEGLKLILWGFFKKLVIADSLAPIVDDIFNNYATYPASTLVLGAVLFSFQIYGDFSGYSDIAIGTAKLFGFELMSNFKFPNFSRNVAEYWQRWHVSLSTWFRHYLYIPLGGSKVNKWLSVRNVCIVFLVSGFWHGANWTFIFWGGLHALFFVPVFLMGKNRIYIDNSIAENATFPSFKEIVLVLWTFSLVTFSRIFFRSPTLEGAFGYIARIFENPVFETYRHPMGYRMVDFYILIVVFTVYEYLIRNNERDPFLFRSPVLRFVLYIVVVFCLFLFYDDSINRSFIYFQF